MQSLPERIRTDEAELFTLPDGRALAYLEWGDDGGYPVFYFHGTPSSRLEGAFADGAAKRAGFRLIAVDRPGFGRSTFQQGRRFRDWPEDVCALADAWGWTNSAWSGIRGRGRTYSRAAPSFRRHGLGSLVRSGHGARW